MLLAEERDRIEEELKDALEIARAGYRLSMDANASESLHEEAARKFRDALERFHRFVLNGVIPADFQDGMV